MRHQRLNQRVEVAVNEAGQIVERDFDAVVGDAVLREIVGADFFAAVAGADLLFAVRGVFGIFLGDFRFEQPRAQHGHRLRPVFDLRTLVGDAHGEAARLVLDLHGGIGGVHALAAFAGRAADGDFDFVGLDLDIHFLRLGQHGDGAVLVWMRPCASVAGTRWTRWTPLSYFSRLKTSVPLMVKMISLNPPRSDGLESIVSIFQPRASA